MNALNYLQEHYHLVITKDIHGCITIIRVMCGERMVTRSMGSSMEMAGESCYMNIYKMIKDEVDSIEAGR